MVLEAGDEFIGITHAFHHSLTFLVESDARFAYLPQVAKLAQCLGAGVFRRHSGVDQLVITHLYVKGELVVDLGGEVVLTESQPECATHRLAQLASGSGAAIALATACV
jgi:hypothetical protein